ncbi:MAG: LytTR family DNA-binding domain-containing protein [Bacillus sp. (in: Bacteria)]|nr:LytTR family DNA-binding domain-containing protein [Bacillus sp. (in: firmicutes)]MCM1426082.1 LytTR family DNA-binding domain-containing protein [Eubacterium sp.]
MLSAAVCDDEITQCAHIAGIIGKIMDEMGISYTVRQFNSGQELLQAAEHFDIIFLDIMMYGPDGMQTARLLREQKRYRGIVVFISSSREYALEAYDVEAFHYLLKPVDEKKLAKILQKAVMQTQDSSREFMLISKERQTKKLFLDTIYYLEIRGRKTDIHTTDAVVTYYEQIGVLEKALQGKGFFRCHKSYIINLQYVTSYTRQEVILDNGERIMIAKRRYESFCKEILAYMQR